MLQYVDGFTCAVNQNRDALSIQFVQHEPELSASSEHKAEPIRTNVTEIASVVMSFCSAEALLRSLQELLSQAEDKG